jgi:hypothetical protein
MLSLVNVISRLMWSHSKISFTMASKKTTGYCYHSVNVVTLGLDQSDYNSGFYKNIEMDLFDKYN